MSLTIWMRASGSTWWPHTPWYYNETCHTHLTIFVPFRMIFNIIAITGPTAGSVRDHCIWCPPSPLQSMGRTSFTMAALTSTRRWASKQNVSLDEQTYPETVTKTSRRFFNFCILARSLLQDPEHPCNIWYNQDHLCSDCSGEDIVKPIQLARLHSNVSTELLM